MIKDFDFWNNKKKYVDNYHPETYCVKGENGKHDRYERPVLILKNISKESVFVIPLTSKGGDEKSQRVIILKERFSFIKLSQARTISTKRLLRKIDLMSEAVFLLVLDDFKAYLSE